MYIGHHYDKSDVHEWLHKTAKDIGGRIEGDG